MEQFAIALVGALAGVLFTEWRRNRRDDRLARDRRRAAARMVSAEFGMSAIIAESVGDGPISGLSFVPTAAWGAHGASLAEALGDKDFYVVMEAATRAAAARSFGEHARGLPVPADPEFTAEPLVDMCRAAQEVLAPLAYPDAPPEAGAPPGGRAPNAAA